MEFLLLVILAIFVIIALFRLARLEKRLDHLSELELEIGGLRQYLSRLPRAAPVDFPAEKAPAAAATAEPKPSPGRAPEAAAGATAVRPARQPPAPPPTPAPSREPVAIATAPAAAALHRAEKAPPVAAPSARPPEKGAATAAPKPPPEPTRPAVEPAAGAPLKAAPALARPAEKAPPRSAPKPAPTLRSTPKRAPAPTVLERPDRRRAPRQGEALARWRRGLSIEELLAGQIFLKIGVAIVVLGVVFFLGYALKELGPTWRVTFGYLGGIAMLAGGLWTERRERYRTFGRALVAGAWAILYFVTFAMHFLPAAQVLASRPLGVLALLAAGGATVTFSLRYRSEWTTLASFLLIFLALFIAAVQLDAIFNLAATTVVTLALAALSWRLGWHRLLGLGAPATWAALAVWLVPHTLGAPVAAPSPWVLLGLAAAWLALQGPVLARTEAGRSADLWHTAASLASLAGVALTLFWIHATTPGAAWLVPLTFGLLYLGSGWRLSRGGRRPLYLLSATTALLLLALAPALYLGLTSRWLTLFWVLEAEMVLAAGVFLRERYFRFVSYLGFLAVTADLLVARLSPLLPGGTEAAADVRLPLLGASILVGLANVYLLRRPWRPALTKEEHPAAPRGFSALASLLLLILLWQEVPSLWLAPVLAALALVWTPVATRFGLRDFLWEAGGWVSFSLVATASENLWPDLANPTLARSAGPLAMGAAALYPAYVLLRRCREERLPALWSRRFAVFFSAAAAVILVPLLFRVLPAGAEAPVLLALGTLYLALALRFGWKELFVEGCALGTVGLIAVAFVSWPLAGTLAGVSLRTLSLLAALAPLYLAYLMLWRTRAERLPRSWVSPTATAHSAAATAILISLVSHAVAAPWQAVTLVALGTLHLALALRSRRGELLVEGIAFGVAGLGAVAVMSWQLGGSLLGLPARTVSVLAALVPLYLAEVLLRRHARGEGGERLFSFLEQRGLGSLATGYLAVASVAAAALVKAEALAFGKNLFVALVWGLMGAVYLEIGRLRTSRAWHLHGHALLAAGTLHLFLVNFLQPGSLGPLSWRLLTVLPFLALLVYIYLGWRGATDRLDLPERARRWRHAYLYAMEAVLAVLLLYEIQRAWVAAGWAALGVGSLLLWRFGGNLHWRVAGSILAVAAAVRGFGVNLYLRDEVLSQRLNLTVLPLTCLLLLAGYLVIRQYELKTAAAHREAGAAEWRHWLEEGVRLAWLLSLLGLLNAFLWVEATGTLLTVWWSLEGLALVALGFLVHERVARQLGLAALSFCVLKLFIYDLRGLEGLMRILSFIVLGLVLIAVSFAYTRFRERFKEIW